MSQWSYVIAAYALVGVAVIGLVAWAFGSMRKAESAVDGLKSRR